jgi:hypothetical protein
VRRRFPRRDVPRAEGEGDAAVWGVQDAAVGAGKVGWDGRESSTMSLTPRLSPQQEQEYVSRNQLKEFLESHSFITTDITPDLGEDFLVRIYDKGVSTGLSFYVQLKSVDSVEKHLLKDGDISYPFEVKDLEHWSVQAVPVILVIWDVEKKLGWWLWINDAIEFLQRTNPDWAHSKTVNVHIPFKNQLNDGALVGIRHRLADLYYPIISKDKVLTIDASFNFPQTPEGKTKLEELKRHFSAGEEVEIDGKYIKLFDFPDWWKRLYGEFEPTGMYLKLGPTRSKNTRPAQIEFVSETQSERIPYVELWTIKQGEEEVTLSNDQQNIPIRFLVVLNRNTRQCQMQISTNTADLDAPRALQILKMQKVLSDGGSIKLTLLDSGQEINLPVPPNSLSAPAKIVLEFAEKLNLIQSKLGITIRWPGDGSFSHKDYQAAEELVSVIEKGIYEQS